MIDYIIHQLNDKNIAILGFGREGKSTYEFIKKHIKNCKVTILDKNEITIDDNVNIICGDKYLDNLEKYDLIMKSPGISLKDIDTQFLNITSQIELLLEANSKNVIGITGTKGKSTTSSLIYNILKYNNKDVVFGGNIGIPVFSLLDNVNNDTLIVLEMSSHQLEFLKVSPHIGIVLNLFQDHLDHAGTVKHYHDIKMNMFRYQTKNDFMIYCSDNETLNNLINSSNFKGQRYNVNLNNKASIYLDNNDIIFNNKKVFDRSLKRNLLGLHNLENIMVCFLVSKILDLDDEKTFKAIEDFKPLEYRLEYFATVNDVKYYVDTLATIPDATIDAIKAIPDINTLIFGGLDRGISYENFAKNLKNTNIEHFICMPKTGHTIAKDLPKEKVYLVDTLKEACVVAKKVSKPGTSCILSPAAASYEYFKNYAEKGEKFKEYILNNKTE